MSWIFTPISIVNTATKTAPTQIKMRSVVGSIGGVVVIMPATTNALEAGIRVTTPEGLLFPVRAAESDDWLYSQKFGYDVNLRETRSVGVKSPVRITIEGFNTDSATVVAQVGLYVNPWVNETDMLLKRISSGIKATVQVVQLPEIEKQLRRLVNILLGLLKPKIEKDKEQ